MLTVRRINYGSKTVTIVTNPDECQVCHRHRLTCLESPWPNHSFEPATAGIENMPAAWRRLPRSDRDHHQGDLL